MSNNQVRADFEKWVSANFIIGGASFATDVYGRYYNVVFGRDSHVTTTCYVADLWSSYQAGRKSMVK